MFVELRGYCGDPWGWGWRGIFPHGGDQGRGNVWGAGRGTGKQHPHIPYHVNIPISICTTAEPPIDRHSTIVVIILKGFGSSPSPISLSLSLNFSHTSSLYYLFIDFFFEEEEERIHLHFKEIFKHSEQFDVDEK
ncbi:hypothetical protein QL285_085873 [Trifolium repens]|nr:hypothetical protein QL285_085873 [Trifolium repens]